MKRKFVLYISIITVMIGLSLNSYAQSNDELWKKGNELYISGDYSGAIQEYATILDGGYSNSELFYNLGNSYYKSKELGKAILNYNRALRLDPFNKDIEHNLSMANAQVASKINAVPQFFLVKWIDVVRSLMSSDGWSRLSLFMSLLTFISIAILVFSKLPVVRKIFFSLACIGIVMYIVSVGFSNQQKNDMLDSNEAIVMYNSTPIKGSPDNNSDDLFILDEGVKVVILSSVGNYTEIEIASGNRGWVESKGIELIDLKPAKE